MHTPSPRNPLGAKGPGVILEDAIVVAILILGGVLEACPDLKVCIAHGGGPACYAMGRLDRGWQGNPDARRSIPMRRRSASSGATSKPCWRWETLRGLDRPRDAH